MSTTRRTILFWFITLVIALFSIILSFYSNHSSTNSAIENTSTESSSGLAILLRVFKQNGLEDFFNIFKEIIIARRHHHHHHHRRRRHKPKCDNSKWNSKLVSMYGVSRVITVDLNGCANFSSVQKAIDAAPDFSSTRSLIILDSGTYK